MACWGRGRVGPHCRTLKPRSSVFLDMEEDSGELAYVTDICLTKKTLAQQNRWLCMCPAMQAVLSHGLQHTNGLVRYGTLCVLSQLLAALRPLLVALRDATQAARRACLPSTTLPGAPPYLLLCKATAPKWSFRNH